MTKFSSGDENIYRRIINADENYYRQKIFADEKFYHFKNFMKLVQSIHCHSSDT